MSRTVDPASDARWWEEAVIYQIYPRSFADSNGDGIGDVPGITAHLDDLVSLGVDAVWISPWYPSPWADGGYDVADYSTIHPSFGSEADAVRLIDEAHARGLRVLLDIVPNHVSDQHPWFVGAAEGDPDLLARFHVVEGRGRDGTEPPNNWVSAFGGAAWHPMPGQPGKWYLHLFAPGQPDLNWSHPAVGDYFEQVLRTWFDRGVDGFRIDVAHGLVKDMTYPDLEPGASEAQHATYHPAWDQDGVHEIYRRWNAVAAEYEPRRLFVGEIWVTDNERLSRFLRPDELTTAFQFDLLRAPWRAADLRSVISDSIAAMAASGAPNTWVLSNHDVTRAPSRYARRQPDHFVESAWDRARWATDEPDLELGRRRARAAALVTSALPGMWCLYQGEELGLEEVEDIPGDQRDDPTWQQSGETDPGRDGCRVPFPWTRSGSSFGFGPEGGAAPWLPMPASWGELSFEAQSSDPASFLALYRSLLAVRRSHLLGAPQLAWSDSPSGVLAFTRGDILVWANTSTGDVPLPAGRSVLVASTALAEGVLAPDTAVILGPAEAEARVG